MQLFYTERFRKSYDHAPAAIQNAFDRRAVLLLADPPGWHFRPEKEDGIPSILGVTRDN